MIDRLNCMKAARVFVCSSYHQHPQCLSLPVGIGVSRGLTVHFWVTPAFDFITKDFHYHSGHRTSIWPKHPIAMKDYLLQSLTELKSHCRRRKLLVTGKKHDLVARLNAYDQTTTPIAFSDLTENVGRDPSSLVGLQIEHAILNDPIQVDSKDQLKNSPFLRLACVGEEGNVETVEIMTRKKMFNDEMVMDSSLANALSSTLGENFVAPRGLIDRVLGPASSAGPPPNAPKKTKRRVSASNASGVTEEATEVTKPSIKILEATYATRTTTLVKKQYASWQVQYFEKHGSLPNPTPVTKHGSTEESVQQEYRVLGLKLEGMRELGYVWCRDASDTKSLWDPPFANVTVMSEDVRELWRKKVEKGWEEEWNGLKFFDLFSFLKANERMMGQWGY